MFLNPFGWLVLTEAVNKLVSPKTFVLDTIFRPKKKQHATDKIQLSIKVGNKKLAPFVKRGDPAHVIEKLGSDVNFFQLPRIRMKKPLEAKELLFEQDGSIPIYAGAGNISSYREQKIGEELQDLKDRITRRLEWMAAQALSGAISVIQDGVSISYDFLMPVANKPALVGTALWSDLANSDPIANIRTWQQISQTARGIIPTVAIARTEVINVLLANQKVKDYLNNRRIVIGQIDTNKIANELGVKYIGQIEGADIYEYNETYTDDAGSTQPFIPADRFVLVSPSAENRLHYGAIEDLDAGKNIAMEFFSKDWITKDPSTYWLLTETSPLTVPHEPETIVYAKVL